MTGYWELYQDFFREESGYLFLELDNLHDKYDLRGPVVRIMPNEVHIKDSKWMDVLYTGPSDPRDRDPLVGTAIGTALATIGTGPHELHRIRKAAISPFFSSRSITDMEDDIQNHAARLFEDLEKRVGEVLDMRVYFFAWTTDFITDTIFRHSTRLFWDSERAADWFKIVWDFSGNFPLMKHTPWLVTSGLALPLVVWKVLFPSLVPYISIYKDIFIMANKALVSDAEKADSVSEKMQEKTTKDIFETILSSDLPLEEKRPKRIANEVFNLLIAGSLTTSKTAVVAVYHLLDNPEVHQRLKMELLEAIPNRHTMLDVKTLQKLPILSAVIKETMRIACVVTTRFPMIAKQKALQYGDLTIPAGSSISMTFCKAAIDPGIFAQPNVFRPQRWLDGSQKPFDYERYVLPFGRGSRVCVGRHLSYAQLYIILAGVFRHVDIELFETTRERDIDIKGGGPLGEPTRKTNGMRIGAGIQITPNASKYLLRWGVADHLPELRANTACFKIRRWEDGKIIGRMQTEEHDQLYGGPYVQVHRADLQRALLKIAARNGVNVHVKSRVVDYDFDVPAMILQDGQRIEKDLVLAADGVKSVARQKISNLANDSPISSGLAVFRAALDASAVINDPDLAHLIQEPGLNLCTPLKRWSCDSGKVVLVGDAAYVVPSFLAQGAAMAIEDAATLARILSGVASKEKVPQALRVFEETRMRRKNMVKDLSLHNLRLYHLEDGEEQQKRDDISSRREELCPIWRDVKQQSWLYGDDIDLGMI
ncbi:hypothetical protein MMC17_009157 [Xylographa soralifera]|nr:hypothetical protein [Xylographa soralifera]